MSTGWNESPFLRSRATKKEPSPIGLPHILWAGNGTGHKSHGAKRKPAEIHNFFLDKGKALRYTVRAVL